MRPVALSERTVKSIYRAVDRLFDRLKARVLEREPGDKRIVIAVKPRATLGDLFVQAARLEGVKRPDETVLQGLVRVATGFVEAQREATKAHVVRAVEAWVNEARARGADADPKTVLGGELAQVFQRASDGVKKILDTEATKARNLGTLDGIVRVNAARGIDDPTVYFVVVRDDALCSECKRLHLLDDEVTPRVWKLSELGHGYHRKGEDSPKLGGLHPHCRCSLVTLMPGYGFERGGVAYVAPDHDEYARQRALGKAEAPWGAQLAKSRPEGIRTWERNRDVYHENWSRFDEQDLTDEHRAAAARARITINFPPRILRKLATSGRFLNQWETDTSEGAFDPDGMRTDYEHQHLLIPYETHYHRRPVYGAVSYTDTHKVMGGAGKYGHTFAVLKPHVHDRASVTYRDSFDIDGPEDVLPFGGLAHAIKRNEDEGRNYVEAQIHGGVTLEHDVAELHAGPNTPTGHLAWLVHLGKKHGIPVFHHRPKWYKSAGYVSPYSSKLPAMVTRQLHAPGAPQAAAPAPEPPAAPAPSGSGTSESPPPAPSAPPP